MPELSIENIEQISLEIKRQEITLAHLADELVDHICCDVENEMQNGTSFTDAYRLVIIRIGPRRIKEIQEETLYAVDSKYRKMKNTMKISGIAGTILFGFATLFKLNHWPSAGILMLLGAVLLALVFMPSTLTVLWKETHNKNRLFLFISGFVTGMLFIFGTLFKIQHWPVAGIILTSSVVFAICFFIPLLLINRLADPENKPKRAVYFLGAVGSILYVAGTLFRIQHWPLASLFLILSLIILFIVVLPWYTWLSWKNETHVSAAFIFIIIGALLIPVPGTLINLNLRNMYNFGYYPHLVQEQYVFNVRNTMNKELIARYRDSACFSKMELLHGKTTSAIACLNNIEKKMVEEAEMKPGKPSTDTPLFTQTENGSELRVVNLSNPFATAPTKDLLMPECPARKELNTSLGEYLKYVTALTPDNNSGKFLGLLDPSIYLPAGNADQPYLTLMSALHSVEVLKNNLLAVEASMLNLIVKR